MFEYLVGLFGEADGTVLGSNTTFETIADIFPKATRGHFDNIYPGCD